MSSRHVMHFPPAPVKPVCYRTRRSLWQRLRSIVQVVLLFLMGLGMALGVAGFAARMHATDARLDAAYLRGLAAGQTMCGGR